MSDIIPYGRQTIDQDDVDAVMSALKSDYLTTGPRINQFEDSLKAYLNVPHSVAVSSGTAALHTAMFSAGILPGDEVIVSDMTFVASANAVIYMGGKPVLADIDEKTLLINPAEIEKRITEKTRAVVVVDYGGQTCDYDAILSVVRKYNLKLIVDACHSLGAEYKSKKAGYFGDVTAFSFHPVKPITTGEGGAVVMHDESLFRKARQFRNHGIDTDHRERQSKGIWYYEMSELGYNYRMTDLQAALGISQLRKLDGFIATRNRIAKIYDEYFLSHEILEPLHNRGDGRHGYHLYVVKFKDPYGETERQNLFGYLREKGIYTNVHYIPVHFHPYYSKNFGYKRGDFPAAERCYSKILSLPVFPSMSEQEVNTVVEAVDQFLRRL